MTKSAANAQYPTHVHRVYVHLLAWGYEAGDGRVMLDVTEIARRTALSVATVRRAMDDIAAYGLLQPVQGGYRVALE